MKQPRSPFTKRKLDNEYDYILWRREVTLRCQELGVDGHVNGKVLPPVIPDGSIYDRCRPSVPGAPFVTYSNPSAPPYPPFEAWKVVDEIARRVIRETVDGVDFDHNEHAIDMMDLVRETYSNHVPGSLQECWKEWVAMRWDGKQDFAHFIEKWEWSMWQLDKDPEPENQLEVNEQVRVLHFLTVVEDSGLFPDWVELQLAPLPGQQIPRLQDLMDEAKSLYRMRPEERDTWIWEKAEEKHCHYRQAQQSADSQKEFERTEYLRLMQCNCCGLRNHYAETCFHLYPELSGDFEFEPDMKLVRKYKTVFGHSGSHTETFTQCDCCWKIGHTAKECFHLYPELSNHSSFRPNRELVKNYKKAHGHQAAEKKATQKTGK